MQESANDAIPSSRMVCTPRYPAPVQPLSPVVSTCGPAHRSHHWSPTWYSVMGSVLMESKISSLNGSPSASMRFRASSLHYHMYVTFKVSKRG